jgi:hypothetical protein
MKGKTNLRRLAVLSLCLFPQLVGAGVTFTNNTLISFTNQDFEGQDIAVTNCIVTLDGPHFFASVRVLNDGTLTHSLAPSGLLDNQFTVTNEHHFASNSQPPTLVQSNILTASVVVTDVSTNVTYLPGTDYVVVDTGSGVFRLALPTGSSITEGQEILVSYTAFGDRIPVGVNLTITNDLEVAAGGAIRVDAKGYGGQFGPGAGKTAQTNYPATYSAGSGGGYGGFGGASSSSAQGGAAYGSALGPSLGSGGGAGSGPGGFGGGAVKLVVGGVLKLDGTISANGGNGTNSNSGGGSGGSVWLSSATFVGAGSIAADGGAGEPYNGGGGGGGRLTFFTRTNLFSGSFSVRGGAGAVYGGAGTVYMQAQTGNVTEQVLTINNEGHNGAETLVQDPGPFNLTVEGGSIVRLANAVTLSSLLIKSNAWVTHPPNGPRVRLTVTTDATIESGGGINVSSRGSPANSGAGAGSYTFNSGVGGYCGGGGAYGGFGGRSSGGGRGGIPYGLMDQPQELGSGGGGYLGGQPPSGGTGGGAIQLNVAGTVTLYGAIYADGGDALAGNYGGGSGGAIWLTAGNLVGTGLISANGGAGNLPVGGGGGGGRIAIQCAQNNLSGKISAYGGLGSGVGGAGTIYLKAGGNTPQVIVDNREYSSTNSMVTPLAGYDLLVMHGAIVSSPTDLFLNSLTIASNTWLVPSPFPSGEGFLNLTVNRGATIQSGGGISADGRGSSVGQGQGAGRVAGFMGGGGGHGGYGGNSATNSAGGNAYGSVTAPAELGSGGGQGQYETVGGAGGGALRITVQGALLVDGRISANGQNGQPQNGGGGSGGSVLLNVGAISGTGTVTANGGAGDAPGGGGGGGGRISLIYGTNLFTGSINAYGGAGANCGGAGTLYIRNLQSSQSQLIVDNGGCSGTNTFLGFGSFDPDLSILNGATMSVLGSMNVASLLVASNGWIETKANSGSAQITIGGNAVIQKGGGIKTERVTSSPGTGLFTVLAGGGGGNGGYGSDGGTRREGGALSRLDDFSS